MTELLQTSSPVADVVLLHSAIEREVGNVFDGERALDRSYARLGGMLARFKAAEGWRHVSRSNGSQYGSFPQYLEDLRDKYGRSQGQLYAYTEVAERLLPTVGEGHLDRMGVSKAFELARAMRKSGMPITPELLSAALDERTTVKEVRAAAHLAYNLPADTQPSGVWMDLGGFYATSEERKEFHDAMQVGVRVLGLRQTLPSWVKNKEVILAALREFNGAHAAEAYGEQES